MNRIYTFLIIVVFTAGSGLLMAQEVVQTQAQTACSQNLEEAQLRFDEGRIQDVEDLLLTCLDGGDYDKAQSVQALRLMILSYIFMEQEGKADTTMLRLLQTQHEFVPDNTLDPVEFINLFNSYRTDPIFKVGVRLGATYSTPWFSALYTTGQPTDEREVSPGAGFMGAVLFEYDFTDNISLYPQIQLSIHQYGIEERFMDLSGDFLETGDVLERQTWISLPVAGKYYFDIGGSFKPYATLGAGVSYLLAAEYPAADNSLSPFDASSGRFVQATLDPLVSPLTGQGVGRPEDERTRINYFAFLGGGLKLKAGEGFIVLDATVNYQINDIYEGGNSFAPGDNGQIPQRIAPSPFQVHFTTLTLGYILNIYKPKKL